MERDIRLPTVELLRLQREQGNWLCVGLDPDDEKLPSHLREPSTLNLDGYRYGRDISFLQDVIDATAPYIAGWKPQSAFYEDEVRLLGEKRRHEALDALGFAIDYMHTKYPDKVVTGDLKRGDIANTAAAYARAAFEKWGFDALTLNGYLGGDSLLPFQAYEGKLLYVLCKTSNPGSGELQDQIVHLQDGVADQLLTLEDTDEISAILADSGELLKNGAVRLNPRYYELVAYRAARNWNEKSSKKFADVGLVVGATYPESFRTIRRFAPNLPILVPGVGKQKGELKSTLDNAGDNIQIVSASGIIFASGERDFAEAAGKAAKKLRDEIRELKGYRG